MAKDWKIGCHFKQTGWVLPRPISKFGTWTPSSLTKMIEGLFVAIAKIMLKSLLLQAEVIAVYPAGKE
jgi:hypothetical protein